MIFCFSGNGNSLCVARSLGRKLDEDITQITASTPATLDAREWRRVVWVFPVYSWGMPAPVKRFIRTVSLDGLPSRATHHLVLTCGDDTGLAHRTWRNAVRKRGWTPKGSYSVIMPNTYVTLPGFDTDSPDLTVRKLDMMEERVEHIARCIRHEARVDDVVQGKLAWLKTRVLYPLFMALLTSSKPFRVSDKCVKCGLCAKGCPMENITMNADGLPRWGQNCAMCLRCLHRCPAKAIDYGPFTRGKGRYPGPDKALREYDPGR